MTKEQDSKIIRELGIDPESGELVTLVLKDLDTYKRIYVYIGDEKNNNFKQLIPQHSYSTVTLDEALRLFKFPRHLGCMPNGCDVIVTNSSYGPSIRYGGAEDTITGYESISLTDCSLQAAECITFDKALELIVIHKKKIENKIKIKKATGIQFDEKIKDKLHKLLVPDSGESESVQGELIRQHFSVMHEVFGNGSGNWMEYKYETNLKGYSKEYFIELAKSYLNDNPEISSETENAKFLKNLQECEDISDIEDLSSEYIFSYDGSLVPDFSKCTTSQEQLNTAIYWDEYLNWMFKWLSDHSLPEWDNKYVENLRNSFEVFRPEVPIGVISDESEEEWHRQNKGNESTITGRDEMNAQSFIESSIYNWIYQNSDLVDLKGNNLNVNISDIFKATK